jgi:hypothetical protein
VIARWSKIPEQLVENHSLKFKHVVGLKACDVNEFFDS